MAALRETNLLEAYRAGMAYWRLNRPLKATRDGLESLARSCGWHDEDTEAWLDGFYTAKHKAFEEAPDYLKPLFTTSW